MYENKSNENLSIACLNGIFLYENKDYVGAIKEFSKAIDENEDDNYYLFRGTAYEDLNDDVNAELDYNKSLLLNHKNSLAAFRLGMLNARKNDIYKAVHYLDISYTFSNKNIIGGNIIFSIEHKIICGNLANLLSQINRNDEALVYVNEALEFDSSYKNAYIIKGIILYNLQRLDEAIPFLQKAADFGFEQARSIIDLCRNEISQSQNSINSITVNFFSSNYLFYIDGYLKEGPNRIVTNIVMVQPNPDKSTGCIVGVFSVLEGKVSLENPVIGPLKMSIKSLNAHQILLIGDDKNCDATIFIINEEVEKVIFYIRNEERMEVEYLK